MASNKPNLHSGPDRRVSWLLGLVTSDNEADSALSVSADLWSWRKLLGLIENYTA